MQGSPGLKVTFLFHLGTLISMRLLGCENINVITHIACLLVTEPFPVLGLFLCILNLHQKSIHCLLTPHSLPFCCKLGWRGRLVVIAGCFHIKHCKEPGQTPARLVLNVVKYLPLGLLQIHTLRNPREERGVSSVWSPQLKSLLEWPCSWSLTSRLDVNLSDLWVALPGINATGYLFASGALYPSQGSESVCSLPAALTGEADLDPGFWQLPYPGEHGVSQCCPTQAAY